MIGASAFSNCSSLTSVMIPAGVIDIGAWAFDNCGSIVIHVSAGSHAEKYAKRNKIPFVAE